MTSDAIEQALGDIAAEGDPTLKHLKLAGVVSAIFRERGIELVVVGGSAIEFYTEGAYVSGDVDLCIASAPGPLAARTRQELMGQLKAEGGPRSWQVAGVYVDILGAFENLARTPIRSLVTPFGEVRICPVEELIVERVLVWHYPQEYPPAGECAKKIIAAALQDEVALEWSEVRRLAQSNAYQNWNDVRSLVHEQAQALQIQSPYDSAE